MKYTSALSTSHYGPSPQSREYITLSPKITASATYTEGFFNQYNSPKTQPARGFVLPGSANGNPSLLRSPKNENPLALSSKSKTASSKLFNSAVLTGTPKKNANNNLTANTPVNRSHYEKKSSSASRTKYESSRTTTSTPKNGVPQRAAESVRPRDDNSYNSALYRWKKLEISTEFTNNTKNSYIVSKAHTTKNTENDENGAIKVPLTQQTQQLVQKSLQTKSMNTVGGYSPSFQQQSPKDEKSEIKFDSKFRSNRPPSANNSNASSMRDKSQTRDNSLVKENTKVNNFFKAEKEDSYGSRSSYKRPPSSAKKPKYDDDVSQSIITSKKLANSTHVDLKSSWQNSAEDSVRKGRRPLSAKKPSRENSKDEISVKRSNSKTDKEKGGDKSPAQKVSLQSFVTKVNKGDVFGSMKAYGEKRDNSVRKNQQKPYLNLEDSSRNKPVRAVELGPKTTPNIESKAVTMGVMKNGAMAAPMQTMPPRNSKNTKSNGTPLKDSARAAQEIVSKMNKDPFIYYMTSLDRAHRTFADGDYFVQIYREHFLQTYQALSYIKSLPPFTAAATAQKRVSLPRRETHRDRKTLVFDMDETLIHCNESTDMAADVVLPIVFPNGEVVEAGINIRPYALEILRELSQVYEIVVFTASHACYANVVLDYLDPTGEYIHHRLFRESCVVTNEGVHVKDLRVFGNRNMQDVILVDNAAYSFGFQIENGIPIIPFYDNKDDQELRHLIPYLKFLNSVKDIREINKQTFRLHDYATHDTPELVLERVVFQE